MPFRGAAVSGTTFSPLIYELLSFQDALDGAFRIALL